MVNDHSTPASARLSRILSQIEIALNRDERGEALALLAQAQQCLPEQPAVSLDHPIVSAINELRGQLFGPLAIVAIVRDSTSLDHNYNQRRALSDAIERFEEITQRMEIVACDLAGANEREVRS